MPRGGKREGAGRPVGRSSEETLRRKATLTELAQQYTDIALKALVEVAKSGSDSARVAASTALLDRGYGKPAQAIVGGDDGDAPVKMEVVWSKPGA